MLDALVASRAVNGPIVAIIIMHEFVFDFSDCNLNAKLLCPVSCIVINGRKTQWSMEIFENASNGGPTRVPRVGARWRRGDGAGGRS